MTEQTHTMTSTVRAGVLDVGYERRGAPDGWPVVLLHGFPFSVRAFDAVVGPLVAAGADVVVPHLRGYGPTRFVDAATQRSGQQAALAHDLLALLDALGLERPLLAGFDWGGRAACCLAALRPERVAGLVSSNGNTVQDVAGAAEPVAPAVERTLWYQYWFHTERGRRGLERHARDLTGQLWREWSPTWTFDDSVLDPTVVHFANPDFADVVAHSYRHRFGLVDGDPAYAESEARLAGNRLIAVPTIALDGAHDTVTPGRPRAEHERGLTRLIDHRLLDAGHATPHEQPDEMVRAVLDLHAFDLGATDGGAR